MGIPFHTLYAVDGLQNFNVADRIYMGIIDVTYASGSAGATVTAAVTWTEPVPSSAAASLAVFSSLPEEGSAWATNVTTLGFTLNVRPQRAGDALAGGIATCLIVA